MLMTDTKIKVTNRSTGSLSYTINDLGIHRVFEPNETKDVTYEELLKLSYQPGGKYLLKEYLLIENAEAVQELIGDVEPEYFYSEQDIENLLLQGTFLQLQDCLEFSNTQGVIDIIKKKAVALQINDVEKRNIIFQYTGFNVDNAIRLNIAMQSNDDDIESTHKITRRTKPFKTAPIQSAPAVPQRATVPPVAAKYKIVSSPKA